MERESDEVFLETVVTMLVDHPDDVKIGRTIDARGVLLTLDVHPEDMGKIIGKAGNNAKALRTLLRCVGNKIDARVNLKINEPEGGMRATSSSDDTVSASAAASDTDNTMVSKTVDEAMEGLDL